MGENLKIVQEIMFKGIKITTTQEQDVSFEFLPLTTNLTISIYFSGKSGRNNGLTKSWSVDVKESDLLHEVLKDLQSIEIVEDDFLG
ncbi:hypothetical protein CPAST_c40560 [Clostridium pasteurianum DSM 525 = ATCC 6013]|uniref:Uncharacterized protein n=1 Tax=Clostridium pasteurianum DSM 525 = ATCC 6013 TaxID=1262449 RepID=A0A0H3JBP4_CLOPA|nr:hypothetical protein [Clostridium pasteurianum]AJA50085.1 hypothetical protein CPAST_c40560 [Clostridium pasteurianum DSM 525 = ATCC 6013]AJA54073.1 hypothetical protein CLPA_c40560 [Clostridium pasteurianum DSM 525 = ATCC 6013]AOZ77203.1 hypothetical protein AQ983_19705 [Clostridium pasteurianum DSM 525 = ATCC 6013]AOZ80999.1 hypothetical protein AQ984_19700 [Clostridium pasteurianum]ELP59214.1 hypothetical protein F502_10038 [Clostridium pasteurianum DSM 525 = ATCC 6013]